MSKTTALTKPPPPVQAPDDNWPEGLRQEAAATAGLGETELLSMLKSELEVCTRSLIRTAVLVRRLEEAGSDLSAIRSQSFLALLRRIAYGQLLPEIAERWLDSRDVLRRVASLPIPEQRKVAADQPMAVVVREGDQVTHRLLRPSTMDQRQAAQVFAGDHIRDEAEQRTWLERRQETQERSTGRPHDSGVRLDVKGRCLRVTGHNVIITASQLSEYLTRLLGR
jgi:hypothetical protein